MIGYELAMTTKKKSRKEERTDVRTTVSLAGVIYDKARKQMAAGGFNDNFSAYVADLIRRSDEGGQEELHRIADALTRLESREARRR